MKVLSTRLQRRPADKATAAAWERNLKSGEIERDSQVPERIHSLDVSAIEGVLMGGAGSLNRGALVCGYRHIVVGGPGGDEVDCRL